MAGRHVRAVTAALLAAVALLWATGGAAAGAGGGAGAGAGSSGTLLFHRWYPTGRVLSTSLVEGARYTAAGIVETGGSEREDLLSLISTANAVDFWNYTSVGTSMAVRGSQVSGLMAALDYDSRNKSMKIMAFDTGKNVPLWSIQVPAQASPASGHALAISANGAVVAAAFTVSTGGGGGIGTVLWFDGTSGRERGSWVGPAGSPPLDVEVSADGLFLAWVGGTSVYVLYTPTAEVIFEQPFGFVSSSLCLSADGEYSAYGFQDVYLYRRKSDFSGYDFVWRKQFIGRSLGTCSVSSQSLALGMFSYDFTTNSFLWYDLPSKKPTPRWDVANDATSDGSQDRPVASSMSDDGQIVGFASWGTKSGTSPQILVFEGSSSKPLYSMVTSGSMEDIDVRREGSLVHVVAGGKHVHNNDFGSGGDIYSVVL